MSSKVFVREATGLVKNISASDALMMSLSGMGLLFAFDIIVFSPGFYPGANPLLTQIAGLLFCLPIALIYLMFSISMPRAGGDYVWVSRILHPSLGFIVNFSITAVVLSFVGVDIAEGVEWGLGEMYYDLGLIFNDKSYSATASFLLGQTGAFSISVVTILILGAVAVLSFRLTKAIVHAITYVSIIIGILFAAVVLSAGPSTFATNFNQLSGANYDAIISAGVKAGAYNGVPPVFTFPTLLAGIVGILSYIDWFFPAYIGGEIRRVKRSQIISQVGGLCIFAVFTSALTAVAYWGEGPAFANSMAVLWSSGSSSFPYFAIPLASGMSVFWTQNPALVSLFNIGWFLVMIALVVASFFVLSRNLFAWSFDRIMPSIFAKVNDRTHTPAYATAAMTIAGIFFAYLAVYQFGILALLFSYDIGAMFIAFIVLGAAAIAFPYRRKDLFQSSDPIVKANIGGLPLVTILGVLSILSSIVVLYAVILPAIGGPFFSVLLGGILPTIIGGAVIYFIAWASRRIQGVDLGLIQKALPPE